MLVFGALGFGIVTGWVTYRTLRRVKTSGLSDIATVIGIVGGAAVTGLFPSNTDVFGAYGVGLAAGFFLYLVTSLWLAAHTNTLTATAEWLGEAPTSSPDQPRDTSRLPGVPPIPNR